MPKWTVKVCIFNICIWIFMILYRIYWEWVYILYLWVRKYFNMWKVSIPHSPFLIDKTFSVTFRTSFRIRIPIDSQPYMKCSSISEKMSKSFHGLIFGNLKITESTKLILATINFREGIQLKTSGSYQNIKVLLKSFRAIWKSLSLFST